MEPNMAINPNPIYSSNVSKFKPLSGWASFFGVMIIISGALSAVILIGIPYIIAGVKLMKAISLSKEAVYDESKVGAMMENLNLFYKIIGITTIALIVLYILIVIGAIVVGIIMATMRQNA